MINFTDILPQKEPVLMVSSMNNEYCRLYRCSIQQNTSHSWNNMQKTGSKNNKTGYYFCNESFSNVYSLQ